MATRPPRVCPRCGGVIHGDRCPACGRAYQRESDARRGSSTERGYGARHRNVFRAEVLRRDPVCRCEDPGCPEHPGESRCLHLSTVADHHPLTRRELVARGLDPDDPQHGRGLCKGCHDHHTATDERTRGGWNKRDATGEGR